MAARKPKRRVSRVATRRPTYRRTRRASNGGNVWSRQEIAFMRKYYRKYPTSWVARQLGRTVYSVRYKASDLSIKKARPSVWRENASPSQWKPRKATPRKRTPRHNWPRRSTRRTPTRRATSRRRQTRRPKTRRTRISRR